MDLAMARRLHEIISILEEIGVLNSNIASAYEMKPARGSRCFLDLVRGFRDDMEAGLRGLVLTLALPVVDYEKMVEHYIKVRRSAARIGACALELAIVELRNAINAASKHRCTLAVLRMRQEYQLLRPHLGTIIEIERRIIYLYGNRTGPGNN